MEVNKRFTAEEKEELKRLVALPEFSNIVECKRTNAHFNSTKLVAWKKITSLFLSSGVTTVKRDVKQLQNLYKNMKKKYKERVAADRREILKTGGGAYNPRQSLINDPLDTILSQQVRPLSNPYDSSADILEDEYELPINIETLEDDYVDKIIEEPDNSLGENFINDLEYGTKATEIEEPVLEETTNGSKYSAVKQKRRPRTARPSLRETSYKMLEQLDEQKQKYLASKTEKNIALARLYNAQAAKIEIENKEALDI